MLNHLMMLYEDAFEKMKRGTKTIEIRLSNEKRKKVAVGDLITFRKSPKGQESLTVIVRDLYPRESFRQLFTDFNREELGFSYDKMEDALEEMGHIYSRARERKEGVLGIRVQVVA